MHNIFGRKKAYIKRYNTEPCHQCHLIKVNPIKTYFSLYCRYFVGSLLSFLSLPSLCFQLHYCCISTANPFSWFLTVIWYQNWLPARNECVRVSCFHLPWGFTEVDIFWQLLYCIENWNIEYKLWFKGAVYNIYPRSRCRAPAPQAKTSARFVSSIKLRKKCRLTLLKKCRSNCQIRECWSNGIKNVLLHCLFSLFADCFVVIREGLKPGSHHSCKSDNYKPN